MIQDHLHIPFERYSFEELSASDQELILQAQEATRRSYAPYSNFYVGAAARLADGHIVSGSNQENAAFPSGLCAERTCLFYANSRYPEQPVTELAIAARTANGFISRPISPCGACRQVILETEKRYGQSLRILLYGEKETYVLQGISRLLPFSFDGSDMENVP